MEAESEPERSERRPRRLERTHSNSEARLLVRNRRQVSRRAGCTRVGDASHVELRRVRLGAWRRLELLLVREVRAVGRRRARRRVRANALRVRIRRGGEPRICEREQSHPTRREVANQRRDCVALGGVDVVRVVGGARAVRIRP